MSIFSDSKDAILSLIEEDPTEFLRFPIPKLHNLLNGYNFGDVVLIGGRKTGGRSSFLLSNYVISPLIQRTKKENMKKPLKIVYINSRHSVKYTMERMVVNYVSQKAGGNKLSIPVIYNMEGAQFKMPAEKSKTIVSQVFDFFDKMSDAGILTLLTGKRSLAELEVYVDKIMEDYGDFDEFGNFTFTDDENTGNVIVAIDDLQGITVSGNTSKKDLPNIIMSAIRVMAKKYSILFVMDMPTTTNFFQGMYKSHADELSPYHHYADRSLVLHNPLETGSHKFLGYTTEDWINAKTGICYFRSLFVASNTIGASGVYVPLFLFPENGYFKQLPKADDIDELYKYLDLITD